MKNYVIGGLICLLASLAIGIKPVQKMINEAMNHGTLKGVETCISYSNSELLSVDSVKATCVRAFQKQLYSDANTTGSAGPRYNQEIVSWGGYLENKVVDYVTTWVRISVSVYNEEGAKQEYLAETPIWIDPLGKKSFEVKLPDVGRKQFENNEFCGNVNSAPISCITWGVEEVMGLSI